MIKSGNTTILKRRLLLVVASYYLKKAYLNCKAGADVIVVGNAIEKDASLIKEMSDAVHSVPVKM